MSIFLLLLIEFFIYISDDTLQNCTLELATLGDLKLVERPHPVVLAPHDFCNIKANVKVSSTENGIIFGNIGTKLKIYRKLFEHIIYYLQYVLQFMTLPLILMLWY